MNIKYLSIEDDFEVETGLYFSVDNIQIALRVIFFKTTLIIVLRNDDDQ